MANKTTGQAGTQITAQQKGGSVADFINYKNRLTTSVLNKIGDLRKGGISVPAGYNADNQIYLAFLKLTAMQSKSGKPMLSEVTPQSVANALLNMCIMGLSLEKGQCAFIQYGNEVQFQMQYHGRVALAKRYGAGEPQAQVIYEGDDFQYEISPKTGKKEIVKHVQSLSNVNKDKIVGAWCLIPYADHPEWEPKVEVMTIEEIRQSWMQGATRGQSPAHKNFPGEMCKKTVISRACKLFISTSDDAGVYERRDDPEWQEQTPATAGANSAEAEFREVDMPVAPPMPEAVEAARETDDQREPEPEPKKVKDADPEPVPEDLPEDQPEPKQETRLDDNFFNV